MSQLHKQQWRKLVILVKLLNIFSQQNGRLTGFSNSDLQELRLKTLKHVDEPNDTYQFPTRKVSCKKQLRFQTKWLKSLSWLAYSKIYDGAYCKLCVSFCTVAVGNGSHEKIGFLVA